MAKDRIEFTDSVPSEYEILSNAIGHLFSELADLDLNAVRTPESRSGRDDGWISIMPGDDGTLKFQMDCRVMTVGLSMPRSALNTSDERELKILKNCCGIVAMMQGAPETEYGKNLNCFPFSFWKAEDDEDANNWEKLSKVWV